MITYKVAVDWSKSGFVHRDAVVGDAPNLFGTTGVRIGELKRTSPQTVLTETTAYGLETLSVNSVSSISFGYDGSTYDVHASPSGGTYTFVVWARWSGPATFTINGVSQGLISNTNEWKQLKGTAVVGASAGLAVVVGGIVTAVYFSGAMVVAGSSAPAGFNSGAVSTYDNLTPVLQSAEWQLGFDEPWQTVAGVERGRMTLNNANRTFSPEYSASPLHGHLIPGRIIRIYGTRADGLIFDKILFTGIIGEIKPEAGPNSTTCTIAITGLRSFLEGATVKLPVQINKTAEQAAYAVINSIVFPEAFNPAPWAEPAAGSWEVFPYLLDNLQNESEADALKALESLAQPMRAKVWFDRDGTYQWRPLSGLWTGFLADLDNTFVEADYRYGSTMVNNCNVKYRKRAVGATNTELLYETSETITLEPNAVEKVRAFYKDTNQPTAKIGATEVTTEVTADTGVTNVLDADAQSAEVTLTNTTNSNRNVTLVRVRGRKLTSYEEASWPTINHASVAKYGTKAKTINYEALSRRGFAKRIADYEVNSFSEAFGEIVTVTVKATPADPLMENKMLMHTLGSILRVLDHNTAHDGYYIIVGEHFNADEGLAKTSVTWTLERLHRGAKLSAATTGYHSIFNQLGKIQLQSDVF